MKTAVMRSFTVFLALNCLDLILLGHGCTNECDGDQETAWCGERRKGDTGEILRCAERTKGGYMCMDTCDYRGESYTWCKTGVHVPNQWDYCSPSDGEVIQVMYTIYGQQCSGKCEQQGKDYWWCYKSVKFASGKTNDANWDYCSSDDTHTRYNKECRNECSPRGEDYYWCHTKDDSWDYCSPRVETIEPEITKGGGRCAGICARRDESYFWCHAQDISSGWWDYCGPNASTSSKLTTPPICLLVLLFLLFTTSI